jgi:redox-sensitive bicupin YhaK (pirin superfamily)
MACAQWSNSLTSAQLPCISLPLKPQVRTSGHRQGPATRLMSPSDLGELLRPFVFLDHFDTAEAPQSHAEDYRLHPHWGIATAS